MFKSSTSVEYRMVLNPKEDESSSVVATNKSLLFVKTSVPWISFPSPRFIQYALFLG